MDDGVVRAASRWRPLPAPATPVEVAATRARRRVTGLAVGRTAFASPAAGWAVVGAPGISRLLYTEDAGVSWTSQLAWQGVLVGQVTAFDPRRAALVLGLPPGDGNVNGYPVAGSGPAMVIATTEDAGSTWMIASLPDVQGFNGMFHALTPRQLWMVRLAGYLPTRTHLARTEDGGVTWAESDGPEGVAVSRVGFFSATHGLVVAPDERGGLGTLHVTSDGGITWTRRQLAAPSGAPATAAEALELVARPGRRVLLLSRVAPASESTRTDWAGVYAYGLDAGATWTGPYRLPMTPTWTRADLAVPGRDGRFWAASGHDVWVADDLAGPWEHQVVPLPAEEVIADVAPAGDGVLWLTTTRYPAPGTPPSGALHRSADGGAHWTRLSVGSR